MSSSDITRCDSPDQEARIVSRLRSGDGQAFEEVVRSLSGRALTTARRLLRNDADAQDAVQDAFLSFFKSINTFKGQCLLATWLHRIVVNAAMMKRRSLARRQECSIDELLPTFYEDGHRVNPRRGWQSLSDEQLNRDETRQMMWKLIDELPDDYRVVLILRDIEQIDTNETAEILTQSSGTIKTRLHRARQALRTLLEKEWG